MRWEDERYVRLYTRDSPDWLSLSFEAQGLFCLLLRKLDRAGVLPLGKAGRRSVAIAIGHGARWADLEKPLEELLADGCIQINGEILVVPNFLDAQEATASSKQRAREYRARARDRAAAGLVPDEKIGTIYFIQAGSGPIKIGFAADFQSRLSNLQTAHHEPLAVLHHEPGTHSDEDALHQRYEHLSVGGEWFHAAPELLADIASRVSRAATSDNGPTRDATGRGETMAGGSATVTRVTDPVTPSRAVLSRAVPSRTQLRANGNEIAPQIGDLINKVTKGDKLPEPDPLWLAKYPGSSERWIAMSAEAKAVASSPQDLAKRLRGLLPLLTAEFSELKA